MAKFKVSGNSVLRLDASAGGTLVNITAYVDTITSWGKSVVPLDMTHFVDTAEKTTGGIEEANEVTLSGAFDDATDGPDKILSTAQGTILSFEYNPAGTAAGARKISAEMYVMHYFVSGEVKGRVNWEVLMKKDGSMTLGTN